MNLNVFFAAIAAVFLSGSVAAQQPVSVLSSNQDAVFDQSGKLRVDQAIIYLDGGEYVLEFRASSMDANCNFTGNRAAWLNVQMVADGGKVLGPMRQAKVASVSSAGGHEPHSVKLETVVAKALIQLSSSFNMAMPGRALC